MALRIIDFTDCLMVMAFSAGFHAPDLLPNSRLIYPISHLRSPIFVMRSITPRLPRDVDASWESG